MERHITKIVSMCMLCFLCLFILTGCRNENINDKVYESCENTIKAIDYYLEDKITIDELEEYSFEYLQICYENNSTSEEDSVCVWLQIVNGKINLAIYNDESIFIELEELRDEISKEYNIK